MTRTNFRPAINPETHPAAFLRARLERDSDLARFLVRDDPAGAGFAARSAAHDARALCRMRAEYLNDPNAPDYYTRAELLAIITEPDDDQDDEPRDDRPSLAEQAEYSASLSSLRR